MRDDAIKKVFDKFEEAIGQGEGVSMDYYLESIGYSMEEAAQQIRQYILDLIGEDEPEAGQSDEKLMINGIRNELRAEQRRKIE